MVNYEGNLEFSNSMIRCLRCVSCWGAGTHLVTLPQAALVLLLRTTWKPTPASWSLTSQGSSAAEILRLNSCRSILKTLFTTIQNMTGPISLLRGKRQELYSDINKKLQLACEQWQERQRGCGSVVRISSFASGVAPHSSRKPCIFTNWLHW